VRLNCFMHGTCQARRESGTVEVPLGRLKLPAFAATGKPHHTLHRPTTTMGVCNTPTRPASYIIHARHSTCPIPPDEHPSTNEHTTAPYPGCKMIVTDSIQCPVPGRAYLTDGRSTLLSMLMTHHTPKAPSSSGRDRRSPGKLDIREGISRSY
jgi:hypothetical protein